jgi:hypothetical protein
MSTKPIIATWPKDWRMASSQQTPVNLAKFHRRDPSALKFPHNEGLPTIVCYATPVVTHAMLSEYIDYFTTVTVTSSVTKLPTIWAYYWDVKCSIDFIKSEYGTDRFFVLCPHAEDFFMRMNDHIICGRKQVAKSLFDEARPTLILWRDECTNDAEACINSMTFTPKLAFRDPQLVPVLSPQFS